MHINTLKGVLVKFSQHENCIFCKTLKLVGGMHLDNFARMVNWQCIEWTIFYEGGGGGYRNQASAA